MTTGVELIANERRRQVKEEKYGKVHDDKHTDQSIAMAAAHYASPGEALMIDHTGAYVEMWPDNWDIEYNKKDKHGRKKQLVIAGALIAAELDRLIRLEEKELV